MSTLNALNLIEFERRRQIISEGWTNSHDDNHPPGVLALAGACYARNAASTLAVNPEEVRQHLPESDTSVHPSWPWASEWWKPGNPIRDLVKAGALIVAEIERLQRAGEYAPMNANQGID